MMTKPGFSLIVLCLLAGVARAETAATPPPASPHETIQITATRLPEDILDVPASVTVVRGKDLEAMGVISLYGALALVGGVSIGPGGDGGPASSVPELMGLREFDAFLLVVDNVPWGGAFNPDLPTLDLTNVDRIEVLRGAAPVLYGATSFVGVIHVIHRATDDTPQELAVRGGSYGSYGVTFRTPLPGGDTFHHAVSASAETQGFKDDRTDFDRYHALWSGDKKLTSGKLHTSVDLTAVRQSPASPHPREGTELSEAVPLDANHNPEDAQIDQDRVHVVASYEHPSGTATTFTGTVALTHTEKDSVRGFLAEDFNISPNANGFSQDFSGDDLYLDGHWAWLHGPKMSVVSGVDILAGKGKAESMNFRYDVPLDGSPAPSSGDQTIIEAPEFEDERLFAGAYAELLWSPAERWRIDGGIRLNATREKQEGEVEEGGMDVAAEDERSEFRPSGSLGASFRAWQGTHSAFWIYGGYTDAFKPAAVDFGPEAEGEILDPETAQTLQGGCKGTHLDGRIFWQASVYRMDFDNLVISQVVNGLPTLVNGGSQRFEGFEIEGEWHARDALTVRGSFAAHTAEFTDYETEFDLMPTQLRGNSLEMSADRLASLGVIWSPEHGFLAWAAGNYVGERWLNKRNTALADPFTALSAGVGYHFAHVDVRLDGENLTDKRDPVSESELGDAQYYRLPARQIHAGFVWHL